jgi:hypothetical protein
MIDLTSKNEIESETKVVANNGVNEAKTSTPPSSAIKQKNKRALEQSDEVEEPAKKKEVPCSRSHITE